MQDINQIVSQAMAFLGSKSSPRKTAAARRNAKLPPKKGSKPRGRPRKAKAKRKEQFPQSEKKPNHPNEKAAPANVGNNYNDGQPS